MSMEGGGKSLVMVEVVFVDKHNIGEEMRSSAWAVAARCWHVIT
jgi:hypothetical protein